MAAKTYKMRALVLRKTKLAEKDLVVTLLAQNGSLVKGVAKGARKPGGSLAARMELFSTVDVLMAQGRSLDVVCEARRTDGGACAFGLEQSACAAPLAELLCTVAQPQLEQPRVFDLSRAAFSRIAATDAPIDALAVAAAALWKVMAQIGFKPSFSHCSLCGREVVDLDGADEVAVAVSDGGIVCATCPRPADALVVDADTVRWCDALIRLRFDDLGELPLDVATLMDVLQLARLWVRVHTGKNLKSLDFLFTSSLLF